MNRRASASSIGFDATSLWDSFLQEADDRFASGTFKYPGTAAARALEALGWDAWLSELFGTYVKAGFAERHVDFWTWVWSILRGVRPEPFIGIWPRGGGKSTSGELATVAIGARGVRAYVLYICETQDQADEHVGNVGSMLESPKVEEYYPALATRRIGKYGSSKGWRREQLRTASGFNVSGIGLDVARRGAKLDEYRPDVIIFDDIDDITDTPQITEKKIATLSKSLLPAGSIDCAVLGMQNLIHANSIFSRFVDGRADFLTDRVVSGPFKAVEGLQYAIVDGQPVITGGRPTWQGQNLARAQEQMRTWGVSSFLSESQQEVGTEGQFFTAWNASTHTTSPRAVDKGWSFWGSLDHGYAHPTAFYLHAETGDGMVETIGEHLLARALPHEHAEAIHALLAGFGLTVRDLRTIVAGSDVFAQKGDKDGHTLADQYAALGITLTQANTERINGAAEMRRRLGDAAKGIRATWRIWTSCPRLIALIPKLIADPKRPEDVLKVDADKHGQGGDDEYDASRYGLMEKRPRPRLDDAYTGGYESY
jgi:hypothetical protein